MKLKPFLKLKIMERTVDQFQSNVEKFLRQLTPNIFLKGVLIEDVSVTTAATTINHKLGKQPQGWLILDQDTNATVWRTSWDSESITLDTSANCTITLWVF